MDDAKRQNEETYDRLMSLIENSQGRLAPIVVACDDLRLREQIVMRYEIEARQAKIRPYRIVLGKEPSLRSGLAKLKEQDEYLQNNGEAVFTVTGTELLLQVKLNPQDEQSELEKFFGYLQWTREGLREFRYPIVLWVTSRILREMKLRAADFWSWRKAELRFLDESFNQIPIVNDQLSRTNFDSYENETLPPLEKLLEEIRELEERSPESAGLATLYKDLGKTYARRVRRGEARNPEQECKRATQAFEKAITKFCSLSDDKALLDTLITFGYFLLSQSQFTNALQAYQHALELSRRIGEQVSESSSLNGLGLISDALGDYSAAIKFHQQCLSLAREMGDLNMESASLNNLGTAYAALKQYPQAIAFYQQSLEMDRQVNHRNGEGASLCNIASTYVKMERYQQAIEFYQAALEIQREVGNRRFESNSLEGLGVIYSSLGDYHRAIDFYQQCLIIRRSIGDLDGQARCLLNLGFPLSKLDQPWEAFQHYQQAKQIYQKLELDFKVEECDKAIYKLNQIIPSQQILSAPKFDDARSESRRYNRQQIVFLCFVAGIAIALLIWFLTRQ